MSSEQDRDGRPDQPDAQGVEGAPEDPTRSPADPAGNPGAEGSGGDTGAGGVRSTSGGLVATALGQTDIGCHRSVNQDSLGDLVQGYAARTDELGLLYAVADGMGGHSRGEVASALAVQTLFERYYAADPQEHPTSTLARVLRDTNRAVHQAGQVGDGGGNMGTTLTVALLRDNTLYVANVGDSRTYRIRGDQIEQLTRDHSLISEQLEQNLLTPEEARLSNIRNVITRAVGYRDTVEPDTFTFPVLPGDIILLCSDGLHGLVEDAELLQILTTQPLDAAVPALIDLARQRGGPDNITALAVRVDAVGTPALAALDTTEPYVVLPNLDVSTDRLPVISVGAAGEADDADDAAAPAEPASPTDEAPAPSPQPASTAEAAPGATAAAPAHMDEAGGASRPDGAPAADAADAADRAAGGDATGAASGPESAAPPPLGATSPPPAPATVPARPEAGEADRRRLPILPLVLIPLALLALLLGAIAFWIRSRPAGTTNQAPPTVVVPAVPTTTGPTVGGAGGVRTVGVAPPTAAPPGAPGGASRVVTGRLVAPGPFATLILSDGWEIVLRRAGDPGAAGAPGAEGTLAANQQIRPVPGAPATYDYQFELPGDLPDGDYLLELRGQGGAAARPTCWAQRPLSVAGGQAQAAGTMEIECGQRP